MTDTGLAKQYYELAFHINSNLDEADVQKARQEIDKTLTSNGGVISFAKDPEKIRLAYPINHQLNAFFGFFNFNLESPDESILKIRDELRLNPNILRFLILKHKVEPKIDKDELVRKMAAAEKRKMKAVKDAEKSTKGETPKADEKEIDEKLEEIIEKL